MNKICITFAGPWWCWKSPLANYLSCKFWLPIINADNIRSEIIEDLWYLDEKIFKHRTYNRLEETLITWKSLIIDASVDREWEKIKWLLKNYKYDYYIISFDISSNLLRKLYNNKWYDNFLPDITRYLDEHKNFNKLYKNDISIVITDGNYKNRLEYSYDKLKSIFNS